MAARLEEAGLRRYELIRAGFRYSVPDATWSHGRQLRLTDDQVDRLEPWPHYVARWMASPSHREEGGPLERWQNAVAHERLAARNGEALRAAYRRHDGRN
jgi:hypothetical protein